MKAFPSGKSETPGFENSHPLHEGMTLRDWLAGKAMQAIISNDSRVRAHSSGKECLPSEIDVAIALSAFAIADAMISVRDGKEFA